jgi:hypothetical protein
MKFDFLDLTKELEQIIETRKIRKIRSNSRKIKIGRKTGNQLVEVLLDLVLGLVQTQI